MKTRVPIAITAVVGVFMILKYFFTTNSQIGVWVNAIAGELEQWGLVTLAFAIVLGILNLMRINLKAVMERKKDWPYKLLLLAAMFGMMIAGGVQWTRDIQALGAREKLDTVTQRAGKFNPNAPPQSVVDAKRESDAADMRAKTSILRWAYYSILMPLGSTIFALLAFYVASAAFRSFRARNIASALLLVTALIVMIGRVPLGGFIWYRFPQLQEWIMTWVNAAGQRALLMGAAVGMIATGIRIIFGIERPYLKG